MFPAYGSDTSHTKFFPDAKSAQEPTTAKEPVIFQNRLP